MTEQSNLDSSTSAANLPETASENLLMAQADIQTPPSDNSSAPTNPASGAASQVIIEVADGNILQLPAGASIDQQRQVGANLEFEQPDGSVIVVPNGAVQGLTIFIGDVEIPPLTVAALFEANGIQAAAGPGGAGAPGSSGGNFEVPVGGIGSADNPFGGLLEPTDLLFSTSQRQQESVVNLPPEFDIGGYFASLSEEGLGEGNLDDAGSDDSTNAITLSGDLGAFDPNGDLLTFTFGQPSAALTSNGLLITWTGVGTGILTGSTTDGVVITATVTGPSGSYSVTLWQPLDHPIAGVEDQINLVLPITASDGLLSATTSLTITIEDDSPLTTTASSVTLDEDGLNSDYAHGIGDSADGDAEGNATSATGNLGILWGADRGDKGTDVINPNGSFIQDDITAGGRAVYFADANVGVSGAKGGALTSHGLTITFSLDANGAKLVGAVEGGRVVIEVTLSDEGSGAFNVQLFDNLDHAAGNTEDDINLTFNYTARDSDGDTVGGRFSVIIDDDMPVASSALVSVSADEDDIANLQSSGNHPFDGSSEYSWLGLGFAATERDSVELVVDFGADGAAAGGGFSFTSGARTTMKDVGLTSKSGELTYDIVGDAIVAYVAGGGYFGTDRPVFSLTLDGVTGEVTYRQYDQLDHVAGDGNTGDSAILQSALGPLEGIDFGAIINATDGDGDVVNLTGKLIVTVTDDVPEITIVANDTVTLDETAGRQSDTDDTTRSSVQNLFDNVADQGSDSDMSGPHFARNDVVDTSVNGGADDGVSTKLELRIEGGDGADSGLTTTDGTAILLYMNNDGIIVGRVGDASGDAAFALHIDSYGRVSVAEYMSLNHPDTNSTNDSVGLAGKISAVYTATDHDGDVVSSSTPIGDRILFLDDAPVANGPAVLVTADEDDIANLQSSGNHPFDGSSEYSWLGLGFAATERDSVELVVDFGADGAAAGGGFSFTSGARTTMKDVGLTSKSGELTYDIVGDAIVAYVAGGGYFGTDRPVFSLTLDGVTGEVTYRQYDQLDHVAGDGNTGDSAILQSALGPLEGIDFGAIINATDGDGDVVNLTGKLIVTVTDDVPEITIVANDTVTLDETAGRQSDTDDTTRSSVQNLFDNVADQGSDSDMSGPHFARNDVVDTSVNGGADDGVSTKLELRIEGGDGADSGLTTTDGTAILLYMNNDGIIVGRVGDASGDAAFALHIDSYGRVSVAEYMSLNHPDTNSTNDSVGLAGKISAVYTATDHDGDVVSSSTPIGDRILFLDDAPVATFSGKVTLQEDADATTGDFIVNSANGTFVFDGGADGAEVTSIAYGFAGSAINDPEPFTIIPFTSGGETVNVANATDNPLMIEGKLANGTLIFTVEVTDVLSGAYTVTQYGPIDHPEAGETGAVDPVRMKVNFTVTDGDGDTSSSSIQIDILDDAPVATFSGKVTLQEDADATTGDFIVNSANGTFVFDGGADGAEVTSIAYGFAGSAINDPEPFTIIPFTSGGETVNVANATDNPLMIEGKLANGTLIFTVEVTDVLSGAYTVTQYGPIDHPEAGETGAVDPVRMKVNFTVTDGDGDTSSSSIHIDILDDAPVIGTVDAETVSEDGLVRALSDVSLEIEWGADDGNDDDGQPGDRSVAFAEATAEANVTVSEPGATLSTATLTSNGVAVEFAVFGTVLIAYTGTAPANATDLTNAVFTVTLSDAGPAGSYDFNLLQPLDHAAPVGTEHYIDLAFAFNATDSDGDVSTNSSFTVRVDAAGTIGSIDYSGLNTGVFVNLDGAAHTAGSQTVGPDTATDRTGEGPVVGIDNVTGINDAMGGSGADVLIGDGGANILRGNGGNDILIAGAGKDTLDGGTGDDLLIVNADIVNAVNYGPRDFTLGDGTVRQISLAGLSGEGDALIGGTGNDTVKLEAASGADGFVFDRFYGSGGTLSGVENFVGTDGNDLIMLKTNYTTDGGRVTIDGGKGNDSLSGTNSADTILGGDGNDLISGLGGSDRLEGGAGDDEIWGGVGADEIYGGADNDTLVGGLGNDTMFGGSGNDVFIHRVGDGDDRIDGGTETGDSNPDYDILRVVGDGTARNFTIGKISVGDEIEPNAIDGAASGAVDLLVSYDGPSAASIRADEVERVEFVLSADDNLVFGDTTGTALSPTTIVVTSGGGNNTYDFRGYAGASSVIINDTDDVSAGDTDLVQLAGKWSEWTITASGSGYLLTKDGISITATNIEDFFFQGENGGAGATIPFSELVNEAPVAIDDEAGVTEAGGTANLTPGIPTAEGNVLNNDNDANSLDTEAVVSVGFGATTVVLPTDNTPVQIIGVYGTLTIQADGTYSYLLDNADGGTQALDAGEAATDVFSYTMSDFAGLTDVGALTVTVTGANDAPLLSAVSDMNVAEDTTLYIRQSQIWTASDPDQPGTNNIASAVLVVSIDNGDGVLSASRGGLSGGFVIDVSADGQTLTITTTADNATTGRDAMEVLNSLLRGDNFNAVSNKNGIAFTPDANFNGDVQLSYVLSDGIGGGTLSTSGDFVITVDPINDAPVISAAVTLEAIAEDSGVRIITQAELLANASDVDANDVLTATDLAITSGKGTLQDNGDGTWTYTPAGDDDTDVAFSYSVNDGNVAVSTSAMLDITPVNDAPVITSNGGGTSFALNVIENSTAVTTVTATDVDDDAANLTYSIGGVDKDLFTINAAGELSFIVAPDFEAPASANGNNIYNVEVQVSDGQGAPDTQTLAITVTDDVTDNNVAPVIGNPDSLHTVAGLGPISLMIDVPTDADGDSLTITFSDPLPTYGVVEYFDAGIWKPVSVGTTGMTAAQLATLRYTPPAGGDHAGDTITYTVDDGTVTKTGVIDIEVQNFGSLFFAANEGNGSTNEVQHYVPGVGVSRVWDANTDPTEFTEYDGKIFFAADGPNSSGRELYSFDPQTGAEPTLFDIRSGNNNSNPHDLTVLNGKLYFAAAGNGGGSELFVYNGTGSPTQIGADDINPTSLTAFDGKLYFSADVTNSIGRELYMFDPAANGGLGAMANVADIASGNNNSNPEHLTVVGDTLYFAANQQNSGSQTELSAYTPGVGVSQIGANNIEPTWLVSFMGKLYFAADVAGGNAKELCVYDPSNPGVGIVVIGTNGVNPSYLTVAQGKLFYAADTTGNGTGDELMVYDGLNAPSLAVPNTNINPIELTEFAGKLYVSIFQQLHDFGRELYELDPALLPTTDGGYLTGQLINVNPGGQNSDSNPIDMVGFDADKTITGDVGNDVLVGGFGNDILSGDDGDDILIGGMGNDTLIGGAGADTFVFADMGTTNVDTIQDYVIGEDIIDLSELLNGVSQDNVEQYVKITDTGANATLQVDTSGTGNFSNDGDVAILTGHGDTSHVITLLIDGAELDLPVV